MHAKTDRDTRYGDDGVDHPLLRRAIDLADLNALRLALLQLTGDPELEAMEVVPQPRRGGATAAAVVAERHVARLKQKAFELIARGVSHKSAAPLSEEVARKLMENFSGRALADEEFRLSYEELGLDENPREVTWDRKPPVEVLDGFKVAIVGGGLSGVALGRLLGRLGIPYTVIDRLDDFGGTWQRNTYPEVRVDADYRAYQFRFEKNYPWKDHFPPQREILAYVKHLAHKHGVTQNTLFGTEMVRAVWLDEEKAWRLTLRGKDGGERLLDANVVVSAAGLFGKVKLPQLPGIERFAGRIMHPAEWDHGYDYDGKDIVLIGNGSSGVQMMPHMARRGRTLTVFQRTPQWIGPLENYGKPIEPELRWLLDNVPYYWNWENYAAVDTFSRMQYLQEEDVDWRSQGGEVNPGNEKLRAFLEGYISSKLAGRPDLIAKSTPSYPPLTRRLVVDNGWYDALMRDNVTLVTDGIASFTESGVIDAAGVFHPADMVIMATGYEVDRYLAPAEYVGRDGTTLHQAWDVDGPRSYLGMMMPGFPNFFMMYGPGSQPRAGYIPSWIEIWGRYVADKVARMLERGVRSVDVRRDVFDRYNASVDARARQLVWESGGAGGYFVTASGRSIVNQPWRSYEYFNAILNSDLSDFVTK